MDENKVAQNIITEQAKIEAEKAAEKQRELRKKFWKRVLILGSTLGIILDLLAIRQGWLYEGQGISYYGFLFFFAVMMFGVAW